MNIFFIFTTKILHHKFEPNPLSSGWQYIANIYIDTNINKTPDIDAKII